MIDPQIALRWTGKIWMKASRALVGIVALAAAIRHVFYPDASMLVVNGLWIVPPLPTWGAQIFGLVLLPAAFIVFVTGFIPPQMLLGASSS